MLWKFTTELMWVSRKRGICIALTSCQPSCMSLKTLGPNFFFCTVRKAQMPSTGETTWMVGCESIPSSSPKGQ